MKFRFLFILLTIFTIEVNSIGLSDSLNISVLTVEPGNELYSTFGHSGIRITDIKNGFDIVFNYGTFDFNTPNFYLKFAMGGLDYMLSVESFETFMRSSIAENRSVNEQVINMDKQQKMLLANLLVENYKAENRFYRYKFFTDNCATRIRDIIVKAATEPELLSKPAIDSKVTFHKLYTSYLQTMPWSKFGIGLVLGSLTNKEAGYDALFLPDNLYRAIEKANLNNNPLVANNTVVFKASEQKKDTSWFSPSLVMLIILILAIAVQIKPSYTRIFDICFFSIFGFLGIFVTTLSIFSHHAELQSNYVILFLLPTNILLPLLGVNSKIKKYYALVACIISILGFLFLAIIPQTFEIAFLLLAIAVTVRLFFTFARRNQHS